MDQFPIGSIIISTDMDYISQLESATLVTTENANTLQEFKFLDPLVQTDMIRVYCRIEKATRILQSDILVFNNIAFEPDALAYVELIDQGMIMLRFSGLSTEFENKLNADVLNWLVDKGILSLYRQRKHNDSQ